MAGFASTGLTVVSRVTGSGNGVRAETSVEKEFSACLHLFDKDSIST